MTKFFTAIAVILFSASAAWCQPVIERLVAAHKGVTDVRAGFTQTTTLEAVELEKVSAGKVVFKRGGKMRWRYEGEDPQLLVSDGELLWIYQERDRTALRREVSSLSPSGRLALDILDGASSLEEHFVIDSCGDDCARLIAKEPGGDVDKLKIELDPVTSYAVRITTFDQVGNITTITFSGIEVNTGAKDSLFTFESPEGVDLFDAEGKPL